MNQHGGIHGGDRRPWLIISRREAIALTEAVHHKARIFPEDLERALRVIERQLKWIDDPLEDDGQPSIAEALRREGFRYVE